MRYSSNHGTFRGRARRTGYLGHRDASQIKPRTNSIAAAISAVTNATWMAWVKGLLVHISAGTAESGRAILRAPRWRTAGQFEAVDVEVM